MPTLSKERAIAEAVLAALLWGVSFAATRWALAVFTPLGLTGLRFFGAFIACVPFLIGSYSRKEIGAAFVAALLPGISLGVCFAVQAAGLLYTSVAKNSFITVLYIFFVPLLEYFSLSLPVQKLHFALVGLALAGIALMCNLEWGQWNGGDLLSLCAALAAALQIFFIDRLVTQRRLSSPFLLNSFQSLWAGIAGAVFLAVVHPVMYQSVTISALVGLAILIFGSTIFAFLMQIRAQRVLPGRIASLLFLLESPFAAFFGYFLLSERMSFRQISGALLVIGAAFAATQLNTFKWGRSPTTKDG